MCNMYFLKIFSLFRTFALFGDFLKNFNFVWGWFTHIELSNRIYTIGFIPEECVVICDGPRGKGPYVDKN